ncbi:peptide deformylase [Engelhardtia mirabilis]|uniref:Peptide deformylase n=1 Tax=Engelhardtia mirabilis TaxID=2528011 RepID=A0A518BRN9_9BACT|nr:Peptide deformylase [Planctomycetes bacterium Pla133]QDV03946.1 Peptide deformylase [Planctomycetes bacterium Pla86]
MADELEFDLTLYPEPVLRKRAEAVTDFDAGLKAIVEAMFRCMATAGGVGLAAPQVGLKRRILVANATGEPGDDLILVNPTILERTGSTTVYEEGCLSFPGIYAEVERPDRCKVRAQDLEGNEFEAEFEGFPSRIVQHEYDHLEGVLLVDRMSPADKTRHRAALEELVCEFKHRRAQATAAKSGVAPRRGLPGARR